MLVWRQVAGSGWLVNRLTGGDLASGVGTWLRLSVLCTPSSMATGKMTSLSWNVDGCNNEQGVMIVMRDSDRDPATLSYICDNTHHHNAASQQL